MEKWWVKQKWKGSLMMDFSQLLTRYNHVGSPEKGRSKCDFSKSICHGALLYRETRTRYSKEKKSGNSCLDVLWPNQVDFAQCVTSQNTEMLGFSAEGLFTRQTSKEIENQVLEPPPQRPESRGIWIKNKAACGLRPEECGKRGERRLEKGVVVTALSGWN